METNNKGYIMKLLIAVAILLGPTNPFAEPTTLNSVIEKEPVVKVTPFFGVMKLKSDYLDYNSTINTGVALDFMLSSRFSIGADFTYSLFELFEDDFAYNNDELDLRQYNIGITTKLFIFNEGVVRPFIGTGINYIHNKVSYADNVNHSLVSYYNDEYYTYGTVAGTVILGSEVRFSKHVGLVIDGRYIQNFASGMNKDYSVNSLYASPIISEGENLEYDLEDAYSASLNVGLIILF